MMVRRIEVANFKSFQDLKLDLGPLNVLIGANAAGKSNFVHIFEFLRDIANSGLDNAVSLQGGVEYLRNMNLGPGKNLFIRLILDREVRLLVRTKSGLIGIKIREIDYQFALKFNKRGPGFKIAEDRLIQRCEMVGLEKIREKIEERSFLGRGEIHIYRDNGRVKIDLSKDLPIELRDIFPPFLREEKLPGHTLLLETPYFLVPPPEGIFPDISIYDFDPKLPKKAAPITGKVELEEDGENLAIILKNILTNKEKRRRLFNLIKDLLPFIENIDVEKFADKSLLFKLKEAFFKREYLPASLISDGTINITALIIALYFEKKPLVIIEEPERNIHPHLISKVMDMMRDAARNKQIIVTTHNPEIVKHAGFENILLVSRNEEGFSRIFRPVDKEGVRNFLKNDIGIEELYIQNLLET
ncbi:ATPase [candidate division WOR-3 bacterium]|uniref:ATPase n=1 Tax=candidate division WOR-3 bacterium TaxID=2052148 RepID=A0A660SKK6_UNCW3|nr:MAG: ATPase [candidate division WOR-3 bacterium]